MDVAAILALSYRKPQLTTSSSIPSVTSVAVAVNWPGCQRPVVRLALLEEHSLALRALRRSHATFALDPHLEAEDVGDIDLLVRADLDDTNRP